VFVAVAVIWQLSILLDIMPNRYFPSATEALGAFVEQLAREEFWSALGQTLRSWAIGFAVGAILALALGVIMGLSSVAYRAAILIVEFLKTVPAIAILPIVVLLYGPTVKMKVILIAYGVLWPLVVQTVYGIRASDRVAIDTARSLRMGRVLYIRTVVLPSAAPYIATGTRLGASVGLILTIITELIGGAPGLGLSILSARNAGQSGLAEMYAYIIATGLVGVSLAAALSRIESRLLRWHPSQRTKTA